MKTAPQVNSVFQPQEGEEQVMPIISGDRIETDEMVTHVIVGDLVKSELRSPIKLPPLQPYLVPIADNIFNAARDFGVNVDDMDYIHIPALGQMEAQQSNGNLLVTIAEKDPNHQALVIAVRQQVRTASRRSSIIFGLLGLAAGAGLMVYLRPALTQKTIALAAINPAVTQVVSVQKVRPPIWNRYPALPDPYRTPGETSLLYSSERLPHETFKKVFAAYGISDTSPNRNVCRLIPVEFGGTNNESNLFPLDSKWASRKWKLDYQLVVEYTRGKITPQEARQALVRDWVAMLPAHNIPKP